LGAGGSGAREPLGRLTGATWGERKRYPLYLPSFLVMSPLPTLEETLISGKE
jgi:hypothetical protein